MGKAGPPMQRGNSSSQSSPEIRFSDVAHYVGLSLMKPSPHKTGGSTGSLRLAPMKSQSRSLPLVANDLPLEDSVVSAPLIRDAKVDQLRCQLEWLKAEQKAEQEQLKKLDSVLSDSLLLEKKAMQRSSRHRDRRDYHQKQATDAEKKIESLQVELRTQKHVPSQSGSPSLDGGRSGSGTGALGSRSSDRTVQKAMTPASVLDSEQRSSPSRPMSKPSPGTASTSSPSAKGLEFEEATQDITLKDYFDSVEDRELRTTSSSQFGSPGFSQAGSSMKFKSSSKIGSTMRHRPPPLSDEELFSLHEGFRAGIRHDLIENCGSAKEAFRRMDVTGSGNIPFQQFPNAVTRLGCNWQEITKFKRERDLFKLFDLDKDGVITFQELFPHAESAANQRCSTPEFWNRWCRTNKSDPEGPQRDAKWQQSGEDELQLLFETSRQQQESDTARKWMSATMKRLKTRGKTDARCREIVAQHLPRGSGQQDRDGVQTFSATEVKACRKAYSDQVNDPVRNIQKVVYDMREQRKVLHEFRQKLWSCTQEPSRGSKQVDEDRKSAIGGLGLGGFISSVASDSGGQSKRSMRSIAQECDMDEDLLEELCSDFMVIADKGETIARPQFTKIVQSICPDTKFSSSDLDKWWEQIMKNVASDGGRSEGSKESSASHGKARAPQCGFEHFAIWYAQSDIRG
mmetsp:Transcript_11323/g.20442  ORF Transcript_11323/g.20442 Transcript_11323/m.20442 type:complete len:683 (-) Transcript_11323:80-2128(-)